MPGEDILHFYSIQSQPHGQEQVPAAIHYEPRGLGSRLWEDALPEPIENSIEYFIRHILEVIQFDL